MALFRFEIDEIDDAGDLQQAKGLGTEGEELKDIHRVQNFGFASNPPKGSHGMAIPVGEERDAAAVFGGESPQHRPRGLGRGVSAFYNAFGALWRLLEAKADLNQAGKNLHLRNAAKVKVEATDWIQLDGKAVYLGKAPYFPVMTAAGPSKHVFAGIDPEALDAPTGSIG